MVPVLLLCIDWFSYNEYHRLLLVPFVHCGALDIKGGGGGGVKKDFYNYFNNKT